jgi:hypothetical protein
MGLVLVACWLFRPERQQAAHWRGTYFSMAANVSVASVMARQMPVDTAAVHQFDALPPAAQRTYRFQPAPPSHLTNYVAMQTGYGYVCALARRLVPVGGDGAAVVVLQVVVHLALCGWLLALLPLGWANPRWVRWAFTLLYAANPLVIRYVAYDFYYFWQAIPGFLLVLNQLSGREQAGRGWWQGPLLGLVLATRPSTLLGTLWLSGVYASQRRYRLLLLTATLALLTGWLLYRPVTSAHWRTIYVGIAAWPNTYQTSLSDIAMYRLYERKTGIPYRYEGNDPAQDARLAQVLQAEVRSIFQKAPLLFVRNAVLNTVLAFSPGYVVGGGWLNYALAVLGMLVLAGLLWRRQYLYVGAVLAAVGTFTPYYPPIPAYLYGAYLPLVMGILEVARQYWLLLAGHKKPRKGL